MIKNLTKKDKKIIAKIIKQAFDNRIRIRDIEVLPDGRRKVNFDYDDGFIEWFKEQQNMRRWSRKKFESIVVKEYERLAEESK